MSTPKLTDWDWPVVNNLTWQVVFLCWSRSNIRSEVISVQWRNILNFTFMFRQQRWSEKVAKMVSSCCLMAACVKRHTLLFPTGLYWIRNDNTFGSNLFNKHSQRNEKWRVKCNALQRHPFWIFYKFIVLGSKQFYDCPFPHIFCSLLSLDINMQYTVFLTYLHCPDYCPQIYCHIYNVSIVVHSGLLQVISQLCATLDTRCYSERHLV